jgi:hypothetical protein
MGTMNAEMPVTCRVFPMQGGDVRRACMALHLTESPASASAIPRTRRGIYPTFGGGRNFITVPGFLERYFTEHDPNSGYRGFSGQRLCHSKNSKRSSCPRLILTLTLTRVAQPALVNTLHVTGVSAFIVPIWHMDL